MKYTFGNIPTTKGEMTKILKRYGVRTADTADGRTVGIKHLKYEELCVLFDSFTDNIFYDEYVGGIAPKTYGTGDASRFSAERV